MSTEERPTESLPAESPVTANAHRRVLVGVDGSEGGRHALAWAVIEAGRRGATLEAVHAWTTPVPISPIGVGMYISPDDDAAIQKSSEELMAELVAGVADEAAAAGVTIEPRVFQGHPTSVLLDRAEHADLLVVGTRGHGTIAGFFLGSISHQIVHHATGPVAVVRDDCPLPAEGPVVVGVDGSEHSWSAARWAVAEAGLRKAKLVVLHGWWTPVAVPPVGVAVSPADHDEFVADTNRMLREMIDTIVGSSDMPPPEIEYLAVEEPAAEAIIDRSRGAALVVVGSRGRGGFAGMLLGSVSRKVLHHAESAVVVIR